MATGFLMKSKQIPMFEIFEKYLYHNAGVSAEEFAEIAQLLQKRIVPKGEFLLRQNEICHHTFFVEKGLLRAYTIDDGGKEHIIQFAPENWFMSDRASTFFNEPSDFFIEAVEDSELILIGKDFMEKAAQLSPAFSYYNERILQKHIRHLQKRINLLLGATAESRYLDFIKLYPDLTLRIPQWMIASYLGITPEGLSRVRKELAKRNFKP
jgi:CRP/FNR family transcriptional regulator, anaerobic regulatory protein